MKTPSARFLVFPLLVMSLLAVSCAKYPGLPPYFEEPKPGVLPDPGSIKPLPLRPPRICIGGNLTQDTVCNYNPTAAALFKGGKTIAIGANGFVKDGTLAVDQNLFYANGKSVKLKGGEFVFFSDWLSPAYVYKGMLAGDQVLEWAPNRSATWKDSTDIRFRAEEGCVSLGTLASETPLPNTSASYCCPSIAICEMTFPTDKPIDCTAMGCGFPSLMNATCGACSSPGTNLATHECCCG